MMTKEPIIATMTTLLRVALGTERAVLEQCEHIVWSEVYALARKQGVLAITFDGLTRLFEQNEEFARSFPLPIKLQWINSVLGIEQRYERQHAVCAELTEKWAEHGIKTLCLKGFAFSDYYPISNHRECGDFDCYLYDAYAKGNDIARQLGANVKDDWYKHSEIVYRKVMIENHQYIVAVRGGKKMKELHYLLDNIARTDKRKTLAGTKIEIPSPLFNALFMNHHSLTHFLSDSIRLRHVLDWALFLQKEQTNLDWRRFYELCEEYDMRAFVDCMTAIAVRVFGVQITNPQIVTESPYSARVLDAIINEDNAILSLNIGAWRKRIMLVQNMFASRWKYEAFSSQGILTKFISLVWGYLMHPEED